MEIDPVGSDQSVAPPPGPALVTSGCTTQNDKTNPTPAAHAVTPGPGTGCVTSDVQNRAPKCQEMSGDTGERWRGGAAGRVSPIQHRAVELLSVGMRISAAARRLGIDERTIYRWKKQPPFVEALRGGCAAPVSLSALKKLQRPTRAPPDA